MWWKTKYAKAPWLSFLIWASAFPPPLEKIPHKYFNKQWLISPKKILTVVIAYVKYFQYGEYIIPRVFLEVLMLMRFFLLNIIITLQFLKRKLQRVRHIFFKMWYLNFWTFFLNDWLVKIHNTAPKTANSHWFVRQLCHCFGQ